MKNIFPTQYSTLFSKAIGGFIEEKYGLRNISCRLLIRNVSDVYIIENEVAKYIFKIYRDSHRNLDQIMGELEILNILHNQNVSVSYPIKDLEGKQAQQFQAAEGVRNGVLFSFAPGKVVWSLDETQLKTLGKTMAQMHNVVGEVELNHERPIYNFETTLLRPLEVIRNTFADLPQEYAYLTELAEKTMLKMKGFENMNLSYGNCHYDLIPKNFHFDSNGAVTIFDFDFAGKGYLVNDLMTFYVHLFFHVEANVITQEKADSDFKILTDAYRVIRSLKQVEIESIPYLGCMFWIFFMGFYVDHFEDWSNYFLTPKFLKARVKSIKKWVDSYCEF